ncbi:hypothetical protein C7964_101432 [Loktanella sp. PT4BL]|jgi:hypothetical protein|uniref:hypothetical protein n=1 Tax=Loktanella sp. PT4BL TaxID=2135611 RepID=UPI000D76DC17|nr:hypothetical protein [Loktanella sp. PT4BL]PXW72322.1 hypothetical protein C7964_101432 [Loktanella sp. PT4BL]
MALILAKGAMIFAKIPENLEFCVTKPICILGCAEIDWRETTQERGAECHSKTDLERLRRMNMPSASVAAP